MSKSLDTGSMYCDHKVLPYDTGSFFGNYTKRRQCIGSIDHDFIEVPLWYRLGLPWSFRKLPMCRGDWLLLNSSVLLYRGNRLLSNRPLLISRGGFLWIPGKLLLYRWNCLFLYRGNSHTAQRLFIVAQRRAGAARRLTVVDLKSAHAAKNCL